MLQASPPARFTIPFASGAGGSFIRTIPQASQIGIQGGAASLTDGFPPLCFQPVAAGGIPPFGEDFNGLMFQTTGWCRWLEAGGPIYYDTTFATGGSGGYPNGAIVQSKIVPGDFWMSTADGNTTDPDSVSSANWVPDPSRIASGTPVPSFSSTVPTGFVASNTLTIGNAASNATGRANSDTLLLYRYLWTNFSNSSCPILTSAGAASTRGANPDADFNANKQLTTPGMRGSSLIGVDGMGGPATTNLAGVPVISGSTTQPGSIVGQNLHTLLLTEITSHFHAAGMFDPTHTHTTNASQITHADLTVSQVTFAAVDGWTTAVINAAATGVHVNSANGIDTTSSAGGGGSHNTVHQCLTVYWNIKL